MGWNRNVKSFATFITGAPHSRFVVVYVWSSQFFAASWADKLIVFSELFFSVDVSTFYMLDQSALSDVEGFAVGATVVHGNVCCITKRAINNLVVELLFQNTSLRQALQKFVGSRWITRERINDRISIAVLRVINRV